MDNTPLKATKESTCSKCGKPIGIGMPITKDPTSGRYIHAGCKGGSNPNPTTQGGQSAVGSKPTANPPPKFSVTENFAKAVEDLEAINGGEVLPYNDIIKLSAVIAEIMHERYSLYISERIQESKEKNIQSVKG